MMNVEACLVQLRRQPLRTQECELRQRLNRLRDSDASTNERCHPSTLRATVRCRAVCRELLLMARAGCQSDLCSGPSCRGALNFVSKRRFAQGCCTEWLASYIRIFSTVLYTSVFVQVL